eukprot:488281_1
MASHQQLFEAEFEIESTIEFKSNVDSTGYNKSYSDYKNNYDPQKHETIVATINQLIISNSKWIYNPSEATDRCLDHIEASTIDWIGYKKKNTIQEIDVSQSFLSKVYESGEVVEYLDTVGRGDIFNSVQGYVILTHIVHRSG